MPEFLNNFFVDLLFLFQRLTWASLLDILLVTLILYGALIWLRDTQAMILLRGVIFLAIALSILTSIVNLPAFSWLLTSILPAFFFAIPVIFAPEIRRGLERLGRAGNLPVFLRSSPSDSEGIRNSIKAVVTAAARLSARKHGALIILQRNDSLAEYVRTGVKLNADVTPEILLQVFYPNTPLHDGAVIIINGYVAAASCVMPLSASGILNRTPDRQMGLRHRAALGISEASDAIAVVVSEETGSISISHAGRMIRRLDSERLENILLAFYRPAQPARGSGHFLSRLFKSEEPTRKSEE